jgi:PAS domain S-box-containing protein
MLNLNLEEIKKILDYISESIIVSDSDGKIIDCNTAAEEKLYLSRDKIANKSLMDFIPEDEMWKLQQAIKEQNNDYYEIVLKRLNGEMFPALVSGKYLIIEKRKLRISTILDMTELKNKEKELIEKSQEQIKKLKSHVITKLSSTNKEKNKIKEELNKNIDDYKKSLTLSKEQEGQNQLLLAAMKKQLIALEAKNNKFKLEILELYSQKKSIEDILSIEIIKAHKSKYGLSILKLETVDFANFIKYFNSFIKTENVVSTLLKLFNSNIREIDIVQYTQSGIFYFAFPMITKNELEVIIKNLTAKKHIGGYSLSFKYGIAHLMENDTASKIMLRALNNFNNEFKD